MSEERIKELLGPDTFSPRAINPDGKEYAYDLGPARRELRRLYSIVTQPGTSVDPDSYDPKNVGTEPETKAKWSFKSPEGQEKNTFP